jgi:hypothetical protein
LNELPLSKPKRALARNETVSNHWLKRPCSEMLDVVFRICHQHLLDKIGSARQKKASRTHTKAPKWSVVAGRVEQEVEEVSAKSLEVAAEDRAPGPWRKSSAD